MSAFTPEQLAYMEAHRDDSRVAEIHWVYSVPIAASIISTALRLWAKRAGRNGITLDDYLIVFATICLIGECASGLGYGPPHGMGRHVIAVDPEDLKMVRLGDYVFSHFYDFALVFVKLGILTFYYRVFVVPLFRKCVLAVIAFVIAWGIGITVTLALVCQPIQAFWDSNVKGKCLHLVEFTYFTNISNLITDLIIFVMPWPVIWHLQLQRKKKLLLGLIFSAGLATCVVSAIRLTVVFGHGDPDFTWYYVPLGAYSAFEPLGGILCTNLPIIWHMWRKRRPLLPGSSIFKSHPSSTATPGSGESRRSRIARSLGLSAYDHSGTDSQARTILGNEDGTASAAFGTEIMKENTSVTATPRSPQYWTRVERRPGEAGGSSSEDARGAGEEAGEGPPKPLASGKAVGAPRSGQGVKKTVWEVRRK
ncbi:uncharacterized protein EI97DRAFT_240135 [Westerdykella ornata]|uniref:Rhodopsin domain-containing protein n=1 Tax=Westerdykella ornata TaxID=318751 RepID=A0A6A6J6T6_WESOR|nr:uncharacterized protein EI97DRAFT_240135 [Westerdykella ornata]KAF2271924.1 hypothetical protein EI97DRAFT_240135 [Westerdykella ornata]